MRIVIGEGSCGIAAGAGKVYSALEKVVGKDDSLRITGCIGMCIQSFFHGNDISRFGNLSGGFTIQRHITDDMHKIENIQW